MRVHGVGPQPCELTIVGEGPGWQEDRAGKPFIGKTGQELDRFLNGIDLPTRTDIFLTNLFREYRGKHYHWTAEDIQQDEPELLEELRRVKPTIIVPLGRFATRWFLGDVDIDSTQGLPFYLPPQDKLKFLDSPVVFPIVHPAAGFHNPEMSPYVVSGFHQLALFLDGQIEPRRLFDDPYPEPIYEEITTESHLTTSLIGLRKGRSLAIDTEGWPGQPWSLQYSHEPGRAYLLRRTSQELLRQFSTLIRRIQPRLVFHAALHDLGMGRSLDCSFEGLDYDDTMVMAYLLQLEPKGLKAGCLRHCNMQMSSYEDIMGGVENERARDYLTWVWDLEQEEYETAQQAEFDRQCAAGRRITVLPRLPKTPLHKAAVRVLQSKEPHRLWLDQVEDLQVAGYHRLGPLPAATLDCIDPDLAVRYGCRDADGTARLLPEYSRRIDALGLRELYDVELSTYPLIDRMHRIGLKPDLDHFAQLSITLEEEILRLRGSLEASTGTIGFNANSGDQVAAYLFGTLGLDEMRRTESGRGSTNDKILEALEHEHPEYPVIGTIRQYREVFKLKNTFVDRLPDFVHRWPHDGRVHATFRTTRVVTGRLAASDPNLLAQPEHGKFASDFKRGWVAEAGHVLCEWDQSQVELRGLAHLSQDPVLLHAFRTGIDLHAVLAERIFGIKPKDQDKSKHRLPAKAINFGIPMGMTCKGLSVELRKNGVDADEDTAQRWLDETLGLYRGVKSYMRDRIEEARRNGYVRCLSGRIRYIGGIRSHDDRTREEAERFAFSTPIQESATFIMKQAEASVYQDILVPYWRQGRWVEPVLQIHDCILVECEEELKHDLHNKMVKAMTNVPKGFIVPLMVKGEWGLNRADTQKFHE